MRSTFIDWLLSQHFRGDNIGVISRWIEQEPDFLPLEFHDIMEKLKDNEELKSFALESLLEYASLIAENEFTINIISEEEIDNERLNIAVQTEKYEEAAILRDKIKNNKKINK